MKRIQKIITDVTQRWKETITGKTPINVGKARDILAAYAKGRPVFEVETPKQFYIAQSVMRGRMTKTRAKELCAELNTDAHFLQHLRHTGGVAEIVAGNPWYRGERTSILDNVMQDAIVAATNKPKNKAWRRFRTATDDVLNKFSLCDLDALYARFIGVPWELRNTSTGEERARLGQIKYQIGFHNSRCVDRALVTRYDAVSGNVIDILKDEYEPANHWFDAIHAEIVARAMGVKNKAATACYEILHHVPAFMQFRKGFLLLTAVPITHVNSDNLLHNETGPAVEFLDANNFWFLDGHELEQQGEKIIMAPDTLTVADIVAINNEEERRIAIDKYGWGRYLQDTGGKVLDYRENWVDNTVEVLVAPGENEIPNSTWRRREPLRMVLACRSTGRKYFIAVPDNSSALLGLSEDPLSREPEPIGLPEPNCELAQKWLSDGGTCEFLPYAKHSLNIVGAS